MKKIIFSAMLSIFLLPANKLFARGGAGANSLVEGDSNYDISSLDIVLILTIIAYCCLALIIYFCLYYKLKRDYKMAAIFVIICLLLNSLAFYLMVIS